MIVLTEVAVPTEGVRVAQPQVLAYFEEQCIGDGTLTISESSVTWVSTAGRGISLTYQSIVLHAVSTDLSSFPYECIYVLVDASKSGSRRRREIPLFTEQDVESVKMGDSSLQNLNLAQSSATNGAGDNDDEDEDSETASNVVIRFVPTDTSVLTTIYTEMCKCQELNPDENDDFSDEEESEMDGGMMGLGETEGLPPGRWYTAETADDEIELNEEGRANLERMLGGGEARNNGHNEHDEDEEKMEE